MHRDTQTHRHTDAEGQKHRDPQTYTQKHRDIETQKHQGDVRGIHVLNFEDSLRLLAQAPQFMQGATLVIVTPVRSPLVWKACGFASLAAYFPARLSHWPHPSGFVAVLPTGVNEGQHTT